MFPALTYLGFRPRQRLPRQTKRPTDFSTAGRKRRTRSAVLASLSPFPPEMRPDRLRASTVLPFTSNLFLRSSEIIFCDSASFSLPRGLVP